MTRDDDIFADALELPAGERAAFLDRACAGDADLRARVDALLAGHESAKDFLNQPLTARPVLAGEEVAGDVLGHYTLMRRIGEGGYGTVWLAEQKLPLHRFVALKIIKLGMDTRSVIARFEAERQALALMAHPDIAQVFDAGSTASGRPFFVMEYVAGVPITQFCDEHSLSLADRLELFTRVCAALQHAHQKGIIHRDLKPSNILVTERDGVPAPKVIDFGIAKATQGRLTEQTLFTDVGQLMGTPAYMSPEQAELRDLDIDTRSDVYSLGVVLYELLTGRPPYDPKSLIEAGVVEIRRIIREVDPPRPSTVIGTLDNPDRETVARLRGAAAIQLTSVLRGDLDWIVMRCLQKNREQRYGTASELADDIRRHLRREPVLARPLELRYRMGKFIARHRSACISAALIAGALVAGTIISVRQAVRATRAEHVAATERDAATAAGRAEVLARLDAQRRQEEAEDLLAFMLGDFRTELKKIGRLDLLDTVGAKAMAYFNALDPRDLTDAALTRQAKALTQIGEVRMEQVRYPEATEAFHTAYTRAAALAARHPGNGDMLFERAQAEFWIGWVARRRGDGAAEREWFTRYRDSALALAVLENNSRRAQLEVIYGHHNLAVVEVDRSDLAAAERGFLAERAMLDQLLAAEPRDTGLLANQADVTSWLGSVTERAGRFGEANRYFTEMTSRYADLQQAEPKVARWKLELAHSLTFNGRLAAVAGQRAVAAGFYARATPWYDELVQHDPANRRWLVARLTQRVLDATLVLAGETPAAGAAPLAETRAKLEELAAAEPTSTDFQRSLARAWRLEARWHLANGHLVEAEAAAGHSVTLGEALLRDVHVGMWGAYDFADAAILAGQIAAQRNDAAAARQLWDRALAALAAGLPDSRDWQMLEPAALALTLSGRTAEARPLVDRLRSIGFQPIDPANRSLLGLDASPAPFPQP